MKKIPLTCDECVQWKNDACGMGFGSEAKYPICDAMRCFLAVAKVALRLPEGITRTTASWDAVEWRSADGAAHDTAVKARDYTRSALIRDFCFAFSRRVTDTAVHPTRAELQDAARLVVNEIERDSTTRTMVAKLIKRLDVLDAWPAETFDK